ncbi:PKD domain-containing protein [Acidisarcina polymorpha]|nr:PKD domain-containing protein [Acidisarcina polymorpha]
MRRKAACVLLLSAATALCMAWNAAGGQVTFASIPPEVSSTHFTVKIGHKSTPVVSAASGYYLLNFDISSPVQVTVTASDPHYWDRGVEVQPMRFGIRPRRDGASITFPLEQPAKLTITRPGEHYADSEMLFLFANKPERYRITANTPGVRYYGPGVHRENIDAHEGDNIYLAAGAVIMGALNIWQVDNVHVSGLGMLLYNGPQDPDHDTGWMHKLNWHVITMDSAHGIEIEGITAVVRSRTWMIQMRDSRGVTFRNVKVVGGSPGNANQDGMDWLGGGDTLVQDSFIRAADDIFAMYGNWDGYTEEALATPGHEVSNITIESSVLSTSISNVVRANWPKKIFDSNHFTLRDSDVIHMGMGSCGVPFALVELWADPAGKGLQSNYRIEDVRLEDWYSLVQLRQPNPAIRDVHFENISAMDGPGLAPSELKGDVSGVTFRDVNLGAGNVREDANIPLQVMDGAAEPAYGHSAEAADFSYTGGLIRPGRKVTFTVPAAIGVRYHWLFGDGAAADGAVIQHSFADADGTLLDGTGRYRVLLAATDASGRTRWSSRTLVVRPSLMAAQTEEGMPQGLVKIAGSDASYEGMVRIPADGGYTLTLLTSTTASLSVDGERTQSGMLRPQVCGSKGAAVQAVRVSVALAAGLHRVEIDRGPEIENAASSKEPVLLWEGPGMMREPVSASALLHAAH